MKINVFNNFRVATDNWFLFILIYARLLNISSTVAQLVNFKLIEIKFPGSTPGCGNFCPYLIFIQ